MRLLLLLALAAPAVAAPRLPDRPPDESRVVVGLRVFTWGGTELEVLTVTAGECHVREVRSGIATLDAETYGLRPYPRRYLAWLLQHAKQKPWDDPDY